MRKQKQKQMNINPLTIEVKERNQRRQIKKNEKVRQIKSWYFNKKRMYKCWICTREFKDANVCACKVFITQIAGEILIVYTENEGVIKLPKT